MTWPISPQAVNIVISPVMPDAKHDLGVNLLGFRPFLHTPSAPLRLRVNELFYAEARRILERENGATVTVITVCILMLCSCSVVEDFEFVQNDDFEFSSGEFLPPSGLVTSPADAAGIAEIIAKSVYGDQQIKKQKPLIVSIKGDVWYVRGNKKNVSLGGVLEIEISKTDGRIIRILHTK